MRKYFNVALLLGMLLKEDSMLEEQQRQIDTNFFRKLEIVAEEYGAKLKRESKVKDSEKLIKYGYKLMKMIVDDDRDEAKEFARIIEDINNQSRHLDALMPYKDAVPLEIALRTREFLKNHEPYKVTLEFILSSFKLFNINGKEEYSQRNIVGLVFLAGRFVQVHPNYITAKIKRDDKLRKKWQGKPLPMDFNPADLIEFVKGDNNKLDFERKLFDERSGYCAWLVDLDKEQKAFLKKLAQEPKGVSSFVEVKKKVWDWEDMIDFVSQDPLDLTKEVIAVNEDFKAFSSPYYNELYTLNLIDFDFQKCPFTSKESWQHIFEHSEAYALFIQEAYEAFGTESEAAAISGKKNNQGKLEALAAKTSGCLEKDADEKLAANTVEEIYAQKKRRQCLYQGHV